MNHFIIPGGIVIHMIKNISVKVIISIMIMSVCFVNLTYSYEQADIKVPILVYHNIVDIHEQNSNPMLNVDIDSFRNQMIALKDAGYETITYQDYYYHVENASLLPAKSIIITFDDGYLSNYLYAYPILKELDMKATIFVITESMGIKSTKYPHFSWNQAREMLDSGLIDIQSHTHTHPDLVTVTPEQLMQEMRISKSLIEKNLARVCNVIAFPYGSANDDVYQAALQAGYKVLNIVGDKGVNNRQDGLNALKRITVNGFWSGDDLIWIIDNNMDK